MRGVQRHTIHEITLNCIQIVSVSSSAPRSPAAIIKRNLGAGTGTRTGAWTTWRVTGWPLAAARWEAAWPALATATGPGTTVAGAARAVHLHTDIGCLSLNTQRRWKLNNCTGVYSTIAPNILNANRYDIAKHCQNRIVLARQTKHCTATDTGTDHHLLWIWE